MSDEKYRNQLQTELNQVEKDLQDLEERHSQQEETQEIEPALDEDFSLAEDTTFNLSIKSELENTVRLIRQALTKIDRGSFGLCEKCGQPINPQRLHVIPYAQYCILCQDRVNG